jgi:ABC-type multidrug transport system ATPase subunit
MAMTISLSDAGKRYNREWIFRHFTYQFEQGKSYAIIGPNGSGKSTLLQAISGALHLNEGILTFGEGQKLTVGSPGLEAGSDMADKKISLFGGQREKSEFNPDSIYEHVSICAPYLELIEEMTLREFFKFHSIFKPLLGGMEVDRIVSLLGLEKAANKQIRYYSSGMKQRVKLAQCILSDVPIVLLDEPCTNLDLPGFDLYHQLINDYCRNRTVIVSSNDEAEFKFCEKRINITDYKNS